jgi:hypothetical protein
MNATVNKNKDAVSGQVSPDIIASIDSPTSEPSTYEVKPSLIDSINAPSPTVPEKSEKPKKKYSSSHKMFELLVWPLVQGVGTWWLSLAISRQATATEGPAALGWLRDGTKNLTNWMERALDKPASSELAQKIWKCSSRDWAETWGLWASVSFGGIFMLVVNRVLQGKREEIIGFFDKMTGKKPQHPDEIEKAPKQTLGSLFIGRLVATAGAASAVLLLGPKHMGDLSNGVGGFFGKLLDPLVPASKKEAFRGWAELAVFDAILTAFATIATKVFSEKAAEKQQEKQKESPDVPLKESNTVIDDSTMPTTTYAKKGMKRDTILAGGGKTPLGRVQQSANNDLQYAIG